MSSSIAQDSRTRVLAAAERLLAAGGASFSMRELAAEAGLSFATPFNQFGSKAAIMQALSNERIDRMTDSFVASVAAESASARILAAVDIASAVMLEAPTVNRIVMGALGAPGPQPGEVANRSRALWSRALDHGDGLEPGMIDLARAALPDQLAVAFRGVLSFWSAGEIADSALRLRARQAAAMLLLAFVRKDETAALCRLLRQAG